MSLLKERYLDLPFIIVSGAVDEGIAVAAMKAGAHDFVTKGNLARLVPAVERELREARDRRERYRAQEELLESEIRYRALFENSSDAIIVCDPRASIVMANKAASRLTGYTVEELTRMNVSQITTEATFERAKARQKSPPPDRYGLVSQRHELQLIRKDGEERTVEAVTALITAGGQAAQIQTLLRDVTEERRARENLLRYAELVTQAQEEERKRVALELHDETAQDLSRLALDIDLLIGTGKGLDRDVTNRLEELRQRTAGILQGVRRFSQNLRLPVLEDFGLLSALQWLSEEFSNQSPLSCPVEVVGAPRRLSPHTELALFRIAQEAVNNARKHADATQVVIRVEFGLDEVALHVRDNGKGFDMPKAPGDFARLGKLGMLGMHERAHLVNGECSVSSQKGAGTIVTVRVMD